MTSGYGLMLVSAGESDSARPDRFDVRTRATIRYADHAAWMVADAVKNAISGSGISLSDSAQEVGVIAVSDQGPTSSMAEINAATCNAISSPLRYAASNPGSLAGVTCIAFGFRGPTLNFIMPPEEGVPVALKICAGWLNRRAARWMVLATHRADGNGTASSRAIILSHQNLSAGARNPITQAVTDWLVHLHELVSATHE